MEVHRIPPADAHGPFALAEMLERLAKTLRTGAAAGVTFDVAGLDEWLAGMERRLRAEGQPPLVLVEPSIDNENGGDDA